MFALMVVCSLFGLVVHPPSPDRPPPIPKGRDPASARVPGCAKLRAFVVMFTSRIHGCLHARNLRWFRASPNGSQVVKSLALFPPFLRSYPFLISPLGALTCSTSPYS